MANCRKNSRDWQQFNTLSVYQDSLALAVEARKFSLTLPRHEAAFADQIRRCADSVVGNIAEGNGYKRSVKKNLNFVDIARGSLYELITWLTLADRTGLLTDTLQSRYFDCLLDKVSDGLDELEKSLIQQEVIAHG